ncbi:hypothetical protein B0H14DRAFT_2798527, partial [Mycena olivaceomarginata]
YLRGRGHSAPAPPISAPFLDTRNGTVSPIPAIRKNIERLASGPFSRITPLQGPISILIACIELMHTVSNNHSAIEELAIQFSRRLDLQDSEGVEQRISKLLESQKLDALSKRGVRMCRRLPSQSVILDHPWTTFRSTSSCPLRRNTDGAIDLLRFRPSR